MAICRSGMWAFMFVALGLGGCSAATDDSGSPEPTASQGEGLSCAAILCVEGTVCVEHGNSARCVKPKREKAGDPCATVKCMAGYVCKATGGTASCEPNFCKDPGGCGPALGMPNILCADGVTVSGPTGNCLDLGEQCGWEVVSCPW